jgi:hypothetical protein
MIDRQLSLTQLAALEALRHKQHNLEETIGRLVNLMESLPEGSVRTRLCEEISCLDSIRDVFEIFPFSY